MKRFATEPAIYGVVLVAGLMVVVGESSEDYRDVLVKVCATVLVFWAAHVYAGTVAHLGDEPGSGVPAVARVMKAAGVALHHSWEMLLAAVPPLLVLVLGHGTFLNDEQAVWAALWSCVAVLGVLGYGKVAVWSENRWARLAGGAATSLLGLMLVSLKTWVH